MDSLYWVRFDEDGGSEYGALPSWLNCSPAPRSVWVLSDQKTFAARRSGDLAQLRAWYVAAGPGRYTLDLDVQDDGGCLKASKPRLRMLASREPYDELGDQGLLSLLLIATGIISFAGSDVARRREARASFARAHCLTQPGPQSPMAVSSPEPARVRIPWVASRGRVWRTKAPHVWPFARLSWYSLLATITYLLLVMIIWVLQAWKPTVPLGLRVFLEMPAASVQSTSDLRPLYVRVTGNESNGPTGLYVDSRPVTSWEEFDEVLRKGLRLRPPNWPVYLEADPDLEWQKVVKPIDAIRGLQAQVVLLARPRARPR